MTDPTRTASPLLQMTETTQTCLWNDSADPRELAESLKWGVVGATCNPVLARGVLNADRRTWESLARQYSSLHPTATEKEVGWNLVYRLSIDAAQLLLPAFERYQGVNGRLSIQTDPSLYNNAQALSDQAVEFNQLAPNMIVKIPVTSEGVDALEEATYRGVSLNATVSFTVAQALAVGEAIERGLRRREAEGLRVDWMGPVCTIMVGRTDDWMRVSAERERIIVDPGIMEWAGVAVFKRAYALYQERGYRTRLLSAAFRNHMHWSQFIGGNVVISPPFGWQERINASQIAPISRIDEPVAPGTLNELYDKFIEFRKAYDIDGLSKSDFTDYGATRRTLRQFLNANHELERFVRDARLSDPDK
jgi:transaldolase